VSTVRFGKRTRNWAANGIRILTERHDEEEGILSEPQPRVVTEAPDEEEEAPMAAPESNEPETLMGGDPTQKLLTSLGRFQRQVNRAEEGAAGDDWTDECMNQLIGGIEIALENGWQDVQEALTDTARILQSYEDAQCAHESVPFLQDSYEILCLMVGDLIVDNVRSGVMQKWRQRYQIALRDLDDAGYELVEDEGGTRAPAERAPQAPTPTAQWEDEVDEEAAVGKDDAYPSNVMPFRSPPESARQQPVAEAPAPEAEAPANDAGEAPFDGPDDFFGSVTHTAEDSAPAFPSDTEVDSAAPNNVVEEPPPFDTPEAPEERAAHQESLMDWGDDDSGVVIPSLEEEQVSSDAEAASEESGGEDENAYDDWLERVMEAEASRERAAEDEVTEEVTPEPEVTFEEEVVTDEEPSTDEESTPDEVDQADEDPFAGNSAEQADLFAAALDEAVSDTPEEVVPEEPVDAEVPPVAEEPAAAPVAEAPREEPISKPVPETPAAVAALDPNSPEALLQIAQQAMTQGNMADARTMALKLAARMAQLEAERAEKIVDDATHALEENASAIREAEEGVKQAESALSATRDDKGSREKTRKDQLKANQDVQGEAESVEGKIADLDEQIRQLQEKRAEEVTNLETLRGMLDEGNAELEAIEAEIASLEAAVERGEVSLDQARAQVAALEEERTQREEALASAEEVLARQWSGLEDISKTYRAVTGESLEEAEKSSSKAEASEADASEEASEGADDDGDADS
jgi:hypothetical protein